MNCLNSLSSLNIVEVDHALNEISAAGINVKILIIIESTTCYELKQGCNHADELFALKRSEKVVSKSKFLWHPIGNRVRLIDKITMKTIAHFLITDITLM